MFLDEFFHGIDNFLAATVAHGNIDGDTGVVVGIAHSIPEALCNVVRQKIKVSDQPHAAVGFRGGEFCNNVGDNVKEQVKFVAFPAQVFGAQKVHSDKFNVSVFAPPHHFAYFLSPHPMPVTRISESCFAGPTAIAVTHHGNVLGVWAPLQLAAQALFIHRVEELWQKIHIH